MREKSENELTQFLESPTTNGSGRLLAQMYGAAMAILQNPEDAKDAVQDSIVRILENRQKYNPSRSLSSWAKTIVSNRSKDMRKQRVKRRRIDYSRARPSARGLTGERDILEMEEDAQRVRAGLNRLPPIYAAVLTQRYFLGWKYTEIAALHNVPLGTVKSRIHKAKRLLRTKLPEGISNL